jgi:cytochrome c oxidase subunit 2
MPLSLRNRHGKGTRTEKRSTAPIRGTGSRMSAGLRWTLILGGLLAAVWPSIALANPPRPQWHPGPPWAPLACKSGEVCEISNLFWIMLGISGIIFLGVATALIVAIVRFSAKEGAPEPTQVFGNRRIELIWTIIPTVILAVAFVATVKAMQDINSPNPTHAMVEVNAIGHQWWWEFQYPAQKIDTANEVHVPTGNYVHFHVESYDVVHSFWTPQLQRQIDANPGLDNAVFLKADSPGVYSGDCYEYCGEAHAWMKFREVVQSPSQFNAWVKHQQKAAAKPSTSVTRLGEHVFLSNTCVNCHAITGTSAGGAVGPNLTHFASRWTIGAGAAPVDMNDLEAWIKDPTTYKPGVIMPGYPYLTSKDLHALATYLLSLK